MPNRALQERHAGYANFAYSMTKFAYMFFFASLPCVQRRSALSGFPALAGRARVRVPRSGHDENLHRKFTEGLAALPVAKHGVELRLGVRLIGLRRMDKRIVAVHTSARDIEADAFVTSLGVGSAAMLAPQGIGLPLYPLKGYRLTAPVRRPEYAPRVSQGI